MKKFNHVFIEKTEFPSSSTHSATRNLALNGDDKALIFSDNGLKYSIGNLGHCENDTTDQRRIALKNSEF